MAPKKSVMSPPSDAARAEVIRVIRDAPEPLFAKAISSLLSSPNELKEAQVQPLLQELASAGTIFELPGTTAKGKPRYWNRDWKLFKREIVESAIQRAAGPVIVTELATSLSTIVKLTPAEVTPILQELVDQGTVFYFPPDKPSGKGRYWFQGLDAIARPAILAALQQSEGPLSAKELSPLIKGSTKFLESDLEPILKQLVSEQVLFEFPPKSAKTKARYWIHDVLELIRRDFLKALDSKGPQSLTNIKKLAKGFSESQFQQVFQSLLESGQVRKHPPLATSKSEIYGVRPPVAGPYFKDISNQVTKVVSALRDCGVPEPDIRQSLIDVVEAAGIVFGISGPQKSQESTPLEVRTPVDLIEKIKQIEPGAERGALVGARELRRVVPLSKTEFDLAVIDLAQQGKLSLHRHDFAASLTADERDQLITDGAGTYYIGMAIRQN